MKTKSIFIFISAVLFASLFQSCSKTRCIKGNDYVVVETRSIEEFSGVVSMGSFNVNIVEDSITRVVIEAESNLIPSIMTRIKGDVLELDTYGCINTRRDITITVYGNNIDLVALEGSGNIYAEHLEGNGIEMYLTGSGNISAGIYGDSFKSVLSGSGNIDLWGEVEHGDLTISGSGNFNTYDMVQNTSNVTVSGSGNVFVHVIDFLEVLISGSGNVFYMGSPQVQSTITGSGNVVPK